MSQDEFKRRRSNELIKASDNSKWHNLKCVDRKCNQCPKLNLGGLFDEEALNASATWTRWEQEEIEQGVKIMKLNDHTKELEDELQP